MTIFLLAIAILLEAAWAILLKIAQTPPGSQPAALLPRRIALPAAALSYILSFVFLAIASKKLDVSIAYALWVGLGTAIIATFGIAVLKEPASTLKLASIALIIAGCVGLNLAQPHAQPHTPNSPPPSVNTP
jgi:small multidrug resistance pump